MTREGKCEDGKPRRAVEIPMVILRDWCVCVSHPGGTHFGIDGGCLLRSQERRPERTRIGERVPRV